MNRRGLQDRDPLGSIILPHTKVASAGTASIRDAALWVGNERPGSLVVESQDGQMAYSFEQYGTEVELWNGAGIGNRPTTFSIHEKNGAYTAIGVIAGNHISQSFDHYPSRQEVEDHFISDPRFTIHFNVVR